jgi:hypothetical protein
VAGKRAGTGSSPRALQVNCSGAGIDVTRAWPASSCAFIVAVPSGGSHDLHARQGMGTARRWSGATANSSPGAARRARTTTSRLGGRRSVHERVAHGERVRMAVRHGRPRRTDHRTEAGLGVRAQHGRGASNARRRRDGAHSGCQGLKPFRLAPFDRVFLQIFQLKWTKWIIGKL